MTSEILDEVRKYLSGPYNDDEELPEWPDEFYITGLLFPRQTGLDAEDLETLDAGGEDEDSSEQAGEDRQNSGFVLQNSIGLRCNLCPDVSELDVEVKYAKYKLEGISWKRVPSFKKVTIQVDKEKEREILNDDNELVAKLSWKVDIDSQDTKPEFKMISIFLSNELEPPAEKDEKGNDVAYAVLKIMRNERILFQPEILLKHDGKESPFLGTEIERDRKMMLEEELSLELLYRNRVVYGQGYSCGADWDHDSGRPSFVKTVVIPEYQAKQIMFEDNNNDERPHLVDMTDIVEAETQDKVSKLLEDIPKKYEKWIANLSWQDTGSSDGSKKELEWIAEENKKRCKESLERIRDGLKLIQDPSKKDVFDAFMLANRAMLYQRVHYDYSIAKAKGKKGLPRTPNPLEKGKTFWRPFQIAFILMNLRGISDTASEQGIQERQTVDLLWFPTGGGKTEAYLGLAAFAIVLRRIRGGEDNNHGLGVSVIMRYTLRLLTLQQFERAATLICALEIFRRKDPNKLGTEPFLIGLWVGWSLTPNSWMSSKSSLEKLSRHEIPDTGSPVQLVFCPWCGQDIDYHNYRLDERRTNWTIAHCTNSGCDFYHHDKLETKFALPVLTVDFDIYRRCPSILIATVDKFARLPWKPESSSIFGIVERKCPRCGFLTHSSQHNESRHNERGGRVEVEFIDRLAGPDLIIQDELHLITGPIGTMVGLYETAVDYLCSWNTTNPVIKPKIVVSTATVKGVETQIKRLYNRKKVQTFPAPGLTFGDTFFWWESKTGGRKYVGVSFSHRSMKFALGRIYASCLQRTREIKDELNDTKQIDPYWTLVAYFNSKRELGGAIRLVEDDVKSNITKIISLLPSHAGKNARIIGDPVELTGQVKGQEIRNVRKRLEMDSDSNESIDVLLATNMISVGIDVDRLGIMVVNGQTKGSSEYIQATGRIGRREGIPGIVFTLYNPYKPRDLSHYENFVGDHLTLQKSVEPVGLTPFSDRAIERALHSVFIGMIRLTIPNLSQNSDADSFRLGMPEVDEIENAILVRYASVEDADKQSYDYVKVKENLQQFKDNWNQFIQESHRDGHDVFYWDDSEFSIFGNIKKKFKVLLTDFAAKDTTLLGKEFPKPTPGSLRDVETEARMFYEA